ncbi:hypothetical protein SDC9_27950 [bioreactor metagenome]|uniref:Chaperone protein TorD n=1 Tax=bioreactor metagenome TaxID=1076179 RepID=A0A644UTG4_9ZZZZ|nr:molecular chaperone TorD family protein [Desulfitobacterium hafniense]MEA5024986.1 molecular chaperone TorD family protein [Desulfitobacterium hafniense]
MLTLTLSDILIYTKTRQQCWHLFSGALNRQPNSEFVDDILMVLERAPDPLIGLSPDFTQGMQWMQQLRQEAQAQGIAAVTTALNVEWLRLFRGVKPDQRFKPARASAYAVYDNQSLLEYYARAGLKTAHPYLEPDYAGVQFAFMAKLVSRELSYRNENAVQEVRGSIRQERGFWHEHMSWLPQLCSQGGEQAETAFYRGLLLFLAGFIKLEQLWLDECI